MNTATITRIKNQITSVLNSHAGVAPARTQGLLPIKSLQGKLYEAHVLATIIENFVIKEKLQVKLISGSKLMLRQKGGAINRSDPYFEVWDGPTLIGDLFTDIYFTTISYQSRGGLPINKSYADYHELDIALCKPNQVGYPLFDQILLAIECKNTSLEKNIIREVLGFRRELSFYSSIPNQTVFNTFPIKYINADPASVHMLYCSDARINRYISNCEQFGIILKYHKL
ncbi:hypothetical protein [Chryseobacterium sp. Marseille-Q3244]|uniref:hypothetical protein n=1 Tax=Chryseobacterium sp. Marseille-Q3244 TaxID=2758092 RepID=UPI002024B73A|nr:hypothetical protein [Chryseobacterium sp. Marseille-Q3244]